MLDWWHYLILPRQHRSETLFPNTLWLKQSAPSSVNPGLNAWARLITHLRALAKVLFKSRRFFFKEFKQSLRCVNKFLFCTAIFIIVITPYAKAQDEINYAVYANIIYRFTKYIDWPDEKKTGDFVIGVVGDSPVFDELTSFTANKTVGSQKIVVKKMSSSASSYNCCILFIGDDATKNLKKIAAATENTPTLIVSEGKGLALKGACINFTIVDDHLKLEINKTNIEKKGLNIATELLNLGVIVN